LKGEGRDFWKGDPLAYLTRSLITHVRVRENKVDDVLRAQERRDNGEPAQRDEGLAIGSLKRAENLDLKQA